MPFTLDERFVRSAEDRLDARLPESYRGAMRAEDGGELLGVAEGGICRLPGTQQPGDVVRPGLDPGLESRFMPPE